MMFDLYLIIYGLLSLSFLDRYPYIHSDECWLASLSRDMMRAHSLSVTESVFNAKVRYPHAIKSFFHLLQQAMIALFGYRPFSVRLLSLLCALVFLRIFYALLRRLTGSKKTAAVLTILLSLEPWFVMISHTARQEAPLTVLLVLVLYVLLPEPDAAAHPRISLRPAVTAALLTGIAIGFHPNSFLLASVSGAILILRAAQDRAGRAVSFPAALRPLLVYTGITALFAAVFVAVSESFTPGFLSKYFAYGAEDFGLDAPPAQRLAELGGFFARLFLRRSGTYDLPETRIFMISGVLLTAGITFFAIRKRDRTTARILAGLLGLTAGQYVIGRFNQMGFIFFFPFIYLLGARAVCALKEHGGLYRRIAGPACILLISAMCLLCATHTVPWLSRPSYRDFEERLSALVPADEMTIANLNTGFYFAQGKLLDYRNLPFVTGDAQGETADKTSRYERIAAYIRENNVHYILFTAELDYLYEHRPYYNVIYGNVMFIPALKEFCETHCDVAGRFTDTVYGARVIALTGQEAYGEIIVYRVRD
ncbi:MAG: glycosyltransferase family 39 protein [Lachnospiraceae bacterium]|nr:glycosyltransferase family 39 protein [Lachnospiraceae bacterium]